MKTLCNIMDTIAAGSEDAIRDTLEEAVGLWAASQGGAAALVSVGEQSVVFADEKADLYVARFAIDEGRVLITDAKHLINVDEEVSATGVLDEMSAKIVQAITEDREDDAVALVGLVLEMKQKVIRAGKLTKVNDAKTRRRNFNKKSAGAKWRITQSAKKNAKKLAFKKTSKLRMAKSQKKRKALGLNETVLHALDQLPHVAAAALAAIDITARFPVIEGTIVERAKSGLPVSFKAKGSKTKTKLCDETPAEKKDGEEATDESIVVVNLKSIAESVNPSKDFFVRAAAVWSAFRAEPVNEVVAELIKTNAAPSAIVEASPFLAFLTEDEAYNAIAPHMEALDPNEIRTLSKAIVEMGSSEEGQKAQAELLVQLGDKEISEAITKEGLPLSEQLDALFLEAEDFDFGAADDLGSDDLGDDQSTDGMGDGQEELDDGQDVNPDVDPEDTMGQEEETVTFDLPADRARDLLRKTLDVIGDEIEDSDEFTDLKAKIDDENQELNGDDIIAALETIGDYFEAVGKGVQDQKEDNAENDMGDERLDDMADLGDAGGAGTDGASAAGAGADDTGADLDLGK